MMLPSLCLSALAVAGPNAGSASPSLRGYAMVDWLPMGRGDLAWIDRGRLSGTGAAETDGQLTTPLRLRAGVTLGRHGWMLGLASWRETTTVWGSNPEDGSDLITRVRVGSLRPSFTYRWWTAPRQVQRVVPYVEGGMYGVVPTVDYRSETWTEAEQGAFDDVAEDDRTRIGGVGGFMGGGFEVAWDSGLSVGARQAFVVHRGQALTDDDSRVSVLLSTETSLTLGFAF